MHPLKHLDKFTVFTVLKKELSGTFACSRSVLAVSSLCRLLRIFQIDTCLQDTGDSGYLEDPVHWKDLTLAKTFEGLSYPSMALHAYSTSPSTCWREKERVMDLTAFKANLEVDSLEALSLALLEEEK